MAPARRSNLVTSTGGHHTDYIDQEAGELYETKIVGNDSSYCSLHTD